MAEQTIIQFMNTSKPGKSSPSPMSAQHPHAERSNFTVGATAKTGKKIGTADDSRAIAILKDFFNV